MTTETALQTTTEAFRAAEAAIRQGGGPKAIERQHAKDRLTARERIARLQWVGLVLALAASAMLSLA